MGRITCFGLVVPLILSGCCASNTATLRRHGTHWADEYESAQRYWRDLPYPRLVKLMDRHDPKRVVLVRVEPSPYFGDLGNIDEASFPVVIEHHTDVFGVPTVMELRKRSMDADGMQTTRVCRMTKWGDLKKEETFVNGKAHGVQRGWYPYPHKQLEWSKEYADGEPDGRGRYYSKEGLLLQELLWKHGKLVSAFEMVEGKWKQTVTDGTGFRTTFWNGDDAGFEEYLNGDCVRGAH
ncbi:MAG: hypothetical protein WBD63_12560 [Phycisphaerae bacterium]|nr:hypothetical protein [Phycisphaerae bacterium]